MISPFFRLNFNNRRKVRSSKFNLLSFLYLIVVGGFELKQGFNGDFFTAVHDVGHLQNNCKYQDDTWSKNVNIFWQFATPYNIPQIYPHRIIIYPWNEWPLILGAKNSEEFRPSILVAKSWTLVYALLWISLIWQINDNYFKVFTKFSKFTFSQCWLNLSQSQKS